jgi:uncharacterized repeat protein (TIGR02543 family)
MKTILSSRKHHYVAKVCIFLIMVALVAGMVGCSINTTIPRYDLTTAVAPSDSGTATDLTNASPYAGGTGVSIKAVANPGYRFVSWTAPAGTFANATAAQTTFTMPAQNVTVTASFQNEVLFSDNFSDDTGVWDTFSDENGSVFYENGWLHVVDYAGGFATGTWPHQHFTDFILEVETKLVGGNDITVHQVICRSQHTNGNYYEFAIGASGYYAISRWIDGNVTFLVDFTRSSYINQGVDAVNLIHIECIGSNLSLSVNGHVLATVTDTTFSGGDIGLGATSLEASSTEIAFDNITVTRP